MLVILSDGEQGVWGRKQEWAREPASYLSIYVYEYVSMFVYVFIPCSDQVTCRNFSVKQNYCGLFFRAAIRSPINMCKLTDLMSCVARF